MFEPGEMVIVSGVGGGTIYCKLDEEYWFVLLGADIYKFHEGVLSKVYELNTEVIITSETVFGEYSLKGQIGHIVKTFTLDNNMVYVVHLPVIGRVFNFYVGELMPTSECELKAYVWVAESFSPDGVAIAIAYSVQHARVLLNNRFGKSSYFNLADIAHLPVILSLDKAACHYEPI